MHIAILTFEGYNELDSLIALGMLNRIKKDDWRVSIATPTPKVRSMNGVVIESMASLEDAAAADAVIVGSGNVATAGGCLASHYLAAWIIARLEGIEAAESAVHYVAPVGEKEEYVSRAWRNITPYLHQGLAAVTG